MITLFHRPKTRATRFIFLLEELEAPYTVRTVTTRNRDGSGAADPANPHPHGKVPAISDDGVVVFESPAIALYLTDKFPAKRLGPLSGDAQRGTYLSWLAYYGGVFEPAFVSKFMMDEVLAAVMQRLAPGPYLLGERFSALDVIYGTAFAQLAPLLPKSLLIEEYVQRVVTRPAYARAVAKDGGG